MKVLSRLTSGVRAGWLVLLGALLLLPGYGSVHAASPKATPLPVDTQAQSGESPVTNAWCPVLTDERVDPEIHTEYRGERVYFCCRKCARQFQGDPAAFAANLTGGAQPPDPAGAPRVEPVQGRVALEDGHAPEQVAEEDSSAQEHDHSSHADASVHGVRAWIQWSGRLHPMWVHFPIALLLAAALAELLAVRSDNSGLAFAARYSLWLGAIGALVAAPLGWANALTVENSYTGASASLLFYHRWSGTSTAALALIALVLSERFRRRGRATGRRAYQVALFAAAGLVVVTGHLGASLIFGWDFLSK